LFITVQKPETWPLLIEERNLMLGFHQWIGTTNIGMGVGFLSALVLVCTALVIELDVSRPEEAIHDHTRVTA
jgi:hypothetical protein